MNEAPKNNPTAAQELQVTFLLKRERRWRTFASNLKDFFFESSSPSVSAKPVETNLILEPSSRFQLLMENLETLWKRRDQPEVTAQPVDSDFFLRARPRFTIFLENLASIIDRRGTDLSKITSRPVQTNLLLNRQPWVKAFLSEVKWLFLTPPEPDYQVTAQPLAVESIFKEHRFQKKSLMMSVATHLGILAAVLFLPTLFSGRKQEAPDQQVRLLNTEPLILHLPPQALRSGGGGGGGRREKRPASIGSLPRAADRQLTPPTPKVVNPEPLLPVEPTVIVPQLKRLPSLDLGILGDPQGMPGPPSSGPGTGGGIGEGTGGGVGPGEGGGVGPGSGGGTGGGLFKVGGGVLPPTVTYRVEPTYSEQARKARYQGVVLLSAIVRRDGTIEILKVLRGLGLGLDERAVDALKQWRFQPGTRAGQPVDVALNIEVNFTLR